MGAKCSRGKRMSEKVTVFGLSGSGKTSILTKLQYGEVRTMEQEIFPEHHRYHIMRNGSETLYVERVYTERRPILYRESTMQESLLYYDVGGAVFVIDSTNIKELDDALIKLNSLVLTHDKMKGKVVMVIANKQDGEKFMSPEDIEFNIKEKCTIKSGISLFVIPTSVLTDGSVELAFDYFKMKRTEGIHGRGLISGAWKTAQMEMEAKMTKTKKFSALHFLKSALTY